MCFLSVYLLFFGDLRQQTTVRLHIGYYININLKKYVNIENCMEFSNSNNWRIHTFEIRQFINGWQGVGIANETIYNCFWNDIFNFTIDYNYHNIRAPLLIFSNSRTGFYILYTETPSAEKYTFLYFFYFIKHTRLWTEDVSLCIIGKTVQTEFFVLFYQKIF